MRKAVAHAELVQSKLLYDALKAREEALRRGKLRAFLQQHQHASQWATAVAAIEDAVRHGVTPSDAMLCDAMRRCGQRGQLAAAKSLYTRTYTHIGRARPPAAHVAFMAACADGANFAEARAQFQWLLARDKARLARNAAHTPVVTDELTTQYLRAALAACVRARRRTQRHVGTQSSDNDNSSSKSSSCRASDSETTRASATDKATSQQQQQQQQQQSSSSRDTAAEASTTCTATAAAAEASSSSSLPWRVALDDVLALRRDPPFRACNELTPMLLEVAAQLAEFGGDWRLCLQMVRTAERQHAVVPPEAYDAAIRACYRHHCHGDVVQLMQRLIATKVAPDEQSTRLALVSAEEVAAMERHEQLHTSIATDTAATASSTSTATRTTVSPWALAMTLFTALKQNGLPLYQQSYEAPLRACALAGQWQHAMTMLQAMRQDGRPVTTQLYRVVLAARVEASESAEELTQLLRTPLASDGRASVVVYLAALRNCLRRRDWATFARVDREMRHRDVPETFAKMCVLVEAAYAQGNYHGALVRFARFDNVTQYERRRVAQAQTVRLYEDDFAVPPRLLDLVLDAYAKVKGHRDPMVEVAYQAALRHQRRRDAHAAAALQHSYTGHTPAAEWMYNAHGGDSGSSSNSTAATLQDDVDVL